MVPHALPSVRLGNVSYRSTSIKTSSLVEVVLEGFTIRVLKVTRKWHEYASWSRKNERERAHSKRSFNKINPFMNTSFPDQNWLACICMRIDGQKSMKKKEICLVNESWSGQNIIKARNEYIYI